MPSKKILVVSIICLGLIGGVWIFEQNSGIEIPTLKPSSQNSLTSENSTTSTSVDWQKILSNSQGSTTIASGLNNTSASNYNSNLSMTDQLAQNFFSQYLDAQGQANQSGMDTSNGLDQNTSDQIASDALSSGNYTTTQTVVYNAKSLNVQPNSNQTTVTNYLNILVKNDGQMVSSYNQTGDEVDIINDAILNQNQSEIVKLDPIIQSYQTLLSNMLKAPVPEDATAINLEIVNSISAVLYDLQAIRQSFSDPVKALPALASYKQDYTNMGLAIQKIETYSQIKMKSFTN